MKNYELELPSGYKLGKHINAKEKKFGIIFNLIALIVLIIVMIGAFIIIKVNDYQSLEIDDTSRIISMFVFGVSMIGYVVLHELVHGIAYKALTKQKLTFGISWSCAFCGVPNIFTYRKVSLVALLAPFTLFTIILIPLNLFLLTIHPLYFIFGSVVFGLHFGGCSGDLYMTYLLLFKYKDKDTLIKDLGPEQYIFIKE